jgi:hypothetical protein
MSKNHAKCVEAKLDIVRIGGMVLRHNGEQMTRHFVIARAASSARFGPQESLKIVNVPAGDQRAEVIVQTRYSPEGFTQPVPRGLWIEATGTFASLDDAIHLLPGLTGFVSAPSLVIRMLR